MSDDSLEQDYFDSEDEEEKNNENNAIEKELDK